MLSVMAAPTPKMGCLGKVDDSLMVIVADKRVDSKQFAGEHVNVRMSRSRIEATVWLFHLAYNAL